MIRVDGLTKRYGSTVAVDDLSFAAAPGQVTGFLGPNGAGKSTTMRLILGLDRPDAGTALVSGRPCRDYREPLFEVGAVLEGGTTHPGRTAWHHLLWLGQTHGIGRGRIAEVLEQTGLADVAHKRVGDFSLGMGQRLGLAAALLGDPPVLILDEPTNGLDPEGMAWIRRLLRDLAAEDRTILVSSHLMSEMEQIAEHVVVIGRGRLIADTSLADLMTAAGRRLRIRTPHPDRLASVLAEHGAHVSTGTDGHLSVAGIEADRVGDLAAAHGLPVHELAAQAASLEDTFLELTRDDVQFRGGQA